MLDQIERSTNPLLSKIMKARLSILRGCKQKMNDVHRTYNLTADKVAIPRRIDGENQEIYRAFNNPELIRVEMDSTRYSGFETVAELQYEVLFAEHIWGYL